MYLTGRGGGGKKEGRKDGEGVGTALRDAPRLSFIPSGYSHLQSSRGGGIESLRTLSAFYPGLERAEL